MDTFARHFFSSCALFRTSVIHQEVRNQFYFFTSESVQSKQEDKIYYVAIIPLPTQNITLNPIPQSLISKSKVFSNLTLSTLVLFKPQIIGRSYQLSLNKFFYLLIPSMRTSKIQNGHQGAPKWSTLASSKYSLHEENKIIEKIVFHYNRASLPVNRLNGDRLESRPLVKSCTVWYAI